MAAKRGQNEGTVRLRKDGRWEAMVSTPEGRKSVYGRTAEDVREKKREVELRLRRGLAVAPERLTLAAFAEQWFAEVMPMRQLHPGTEEEYRRVWRLYLDPKLGGVRLTRLSAQDVQANWNALDRRGLSPRTVQAARNVLKMLLRTAEQWGLVERNVAKVTETKRIAKRTVPAISVAQARALLAAFEDSQWEAAVALGLLGLRSEEARALTWRDIDLKERVVRVGKTVRYVDHALVVYERTKTEKSRRVVPLPAFVLPMLERHRARLAERRAFAGSAWVERNLVLPNEVGGHLHAPRLVTAVQKGMRAAGLAPCRFHDLRHHFATVCDAVGISDREKMALLGHTRLQQTMDYAHPSPDALRAAMDKLDAAWGQSAD